jgi:hypothetical protein
VPVAPTTEPAKKEVKEVKKEAAKPTLQPAKKK